MAKKTIYPRTQGRKNKVLKGPIDLTGTNKVPIVGYCPVGKSPTRLDFSMQTTSIYIRDRATSKKYSISFMKLLI